MAEYVGGRADPDFVLRLNAQLYQSPQVLGQDQHDEQDTGIIILSILFILSEI